MSTIELCQLIHARALTVCRSFNKALGINCRIVFLISREAKQILEADFLLTGSDVCELKTLLGCEVIETMDSNEQDPIRFLIEYVPEASK